MERRIRLKPCRVCGEVPTMGYCLGEYFVYGKDLSCTGCGVMYRETATSEKGMAEKWNGRN